MYVIYCLMLHLILGHEDTGMMDYYFVQRREEDAYIIKSSPCGSQRATELPDEHVK